MPYLLFDDEIAEMYLEGEEIPADRLRSVIRKATVSGSMVPVLCGTSYKNKGVQKLLDAVVDFLPSPAGCSARCRREPQDGRRGVTLPADVNGPFAGLVFKVMTDPFVGRLAFIRVYSGSIKAGETAMNTVRGPARASRPSAAHAREPS